MYWKNKLSVGFGAGLAAGILMDLFEYISFYLFQLPKIRSIDWVAIVIYGRVPLGVYELAVAQILHLLLTAGWGSLYMYVGSYIRIRNGYLKGWKWAVIIWFVSNTLIAVLKLPRHDEVGLTSMIVYFVFASFYGLILGGITDRFKLT